MGTLGGVYWTGVLVTALEVEWSQGTRWMESLTLAELTQNNCDVSLRTLLLNNPWLREFLKVPFPLFLFP